MAKGRGASQDHAYAIARVSEQTLADVADMLSLVRELTTG